MDLTVVFIGHGDDNVGAHMLTVTSRDGRCP